MAIKQEEHPCIECKKVSFLPDGWYTCPNKIFIHKRTYVLYDDEVGSCFERDPDFIK